METVPGGSIEGRPHPNGPMDTGCQWEAHPTSSLVLDETSPVFLSYHCQGTWEGTDIGGQSVQEKKKTGHGEPGETPCLLPCATKGCFAAPQHSALQQSPALGALQHPCFDSIFAQFCSFAATCAFKVLCSTSLCFAALNALKHFAHSSFAACAYEWRSCSRSSWLGAWFLNRSWQGEWK